MTLERQFARLALETREVRRRLENQERTGKVTRHHDDDPNLIKVDIGPEGSVVETPWIRWRERAGSVSTYGKPAIGEQVTVTSPAGEIGTRSWATAGGFSTDNPAPHNKAGEFMQKVGGCTFLQTPEGIEITGNLKVNGNSLLNGEVDLGGEGGEEAGIRGSVDIAGHALVSALSSKVRIVK